MLPPNLESLASKAGLSVLYKESFIDRGCRILSPRSPRMGQS